MGNRIPFYFNAFPAKKQPRSWEVCYSWFRRPSAQNKNAWMRVRIETAGGGKPPSLRAKRSNPAGPPTPRRKSKTRGCVCGTGTERSLQYSIFGTKNDQKIISEKIKKILAFLIAL
ncbi:MAG: hypothetical protein LBT26_10645 [Clostridiales Family XIII bacterium]|nr:hypothetical protein [Clostridiales Family XIII bacterium]